jgi:hypothetical protein
MHSRICTIPSVSRRRAARIALATKEAPDWTEGGRMLLGECASKTSIGAARVAVAKHGSGRRRPHTLVGR